jgi:predicted RNA-binding Zn ribbon-like protein
VPAHIRLILDAANTVDVGEAKDAWATPADLARWLQARTGAAASARVSGSDHAAAVRLRDALRAVIAGRDAPDLDDLAAHFPLRLRWQDGLPELSPVAQTPVGGVARVLAAIARATAEGTWDRIKICPADTCQVAFFDESRNRSRAWCSMRVCGNRTKTRTYRARHPQGSARP